MSPALDLRTLDRPLDAIDVLLLVQQVCNARAEAGYDPAGHGSASDSAPSADTAGAPRRRTVDAA